jgi:hypothetical protein
MTYDNIQLFSMLQSYTRPHTVHLNRKSVFSDGAVDSRFHSISDATLHMTGPHHGLLRTDSRSLQDQYSGLYSGSLLVGYNARLIM